MIVSYNEVTRKATAEGFTLFRVRERIGVRWYFLVCNDTWTKEGLAVAAATATRFGHLWRVAEFFNIPGATASHEQATKYAPRCQIRARISERKARRDGTAPYLARNNDELRRSQS